MGKQAPAPPDYKGAAQQQGQSSAGTTNAQTNANRPNQYTPFASSSWQQGPDGKWTQSSNFSGPLQGAAEGLGGQAAGNLANPMDWSQFGPLDDGSAAREQAIGAAYDQATSRLNPQWERAGQLNASSLANAGLDPNSQAARTQNLQFQQGKNDAYGSAMNSAIQQGTAAQTATFNQNLMARQQAIAEALRQRGQPVEDMKGLQGLLGQQNFMGAGKADPTQFLAAAGAQGNYGLDAWNMQNQANADMWGGGMQAAGGAASFLPFLLSDERAKTNINRLSIEALPGVPFASWDYLPEHGGESSFGVIAQDLEKVAPQFVKTRADGLKMVDYSFLGGR